MIAMRRSDQNISEENALYRNIEQQQQQQQGAAGNSSELSSLLAARASQERAAYAGLSSPHRAPTDLQLLFAQQQGQSSQNNDLQTLLLQRRLEGLRESDNTAATMLQRHREEELLQMAHQRQIEDILASRTGTGAAGAPPRPSLQEQLLAARSSSLGHPPQPQLSMIRALQAQEAELGSSALASSNIALSSGSRSELPVSRESSERSAGADSLSKGGIKSKTEESEEGAESDKEEHDSNSDTFPFKLFRMLSEAEKEGQDDIISFLQHGQAFAIHKPREFVAEMMPKYFTTSRMSSFQRQLNLYGFRRITEGRDKGGYYHDSFVKGRKSLCKNIKRKKTAAKSPNNFFGGQLAAGSGTLGALSGLEAQIGTGALASNMSVRQLLANAQGIGAQRGLDAGLLGGAVGASGLLGRGVGGLTPGLAAALAVEQRQRSQQAELLHLLLQQQEEERRAKLASDSAIARSLGRNNE